MIVYEQHFEHLKEQTQTICKYVASENPFFHINCWHSDGISRTWHISLWLLFLRSSMLFAAFNIYFVFTFPLIINVKRIFHACEFVFFVLVWKRTFFFGKLHKNINGFSSRTEILRRICDEFLLKQLKLRNNCLWRVNFLKSIP